LNKCISCPYFNISLWTLSCDVGSSGIISFEAFKTYHFFSIVERFGPMWTPMSLAHVSRVGCRRMNRRAKMMNIRVFFVGFFFFFYLATNHSGFNTFALLVQKLWNYLFAHHLVEGFPMILKAQQGTPQFKRVKMWSKTKQNKTNIYLP